MPDEIEKPRRRSPITITDETTADQLREMMAANEGEKVRHSRRRPTKGSAEAAKTDVAGIKPVELVAQAMAPPTEIEKPDVVGNFPMTPEGDEALANFVVDVVMRLRAYLEKYRPQIDDLKARFLKLPRDRANRGKYAIAGCRTWKEFCECKLNYTESAIRKALAAPKESKKPRILLEKLMCWAPVMRTNSNLTYSNYVRFSVASNGNVLVSGVGISAQINLVLDIPAPTPGPDDPPFDICVLTEELTETLKRLDGDPLLIRGRNGILIKQSADGQLRFSYSDAGAVGNFKCMLLTVDAEKFPAIPIATGEDGEMIRTLETADDLFTPIATLDLEAFKEQIDRILFAVPDDNGKYLVTTALLHSADKQLNLAATDGHRLIVITEDADVGSDFRIQLPKEALKLLKLLDGASKVTLFQHDTKPNEGYFRFTTPTETLIVCKGSGSFPPYERVFQNTPTNLGSLGIKQADLLTSLRRALPLADRDVPLVVLAYTAGDTLLRLKAVREESGYVVDAITVAPTGPVRSFETKINGAFLKEWLEHLGGEIILYVPAANDAPLYLANGAYGAYKYILAPTVRTATQAIPPKAETPYTGDFLPGLKKGDQVTIGLADGSEGSKVLSVVEVRGNKVHLSVAGKGTDVVLPRDGSNGQGLWKILREANDEDRQRVAEETSRQEADEAARKQREKEVAHQVRSLLKQFPSNIKIKGEPGVGIHEIQGEYSAHFPLWFVTIPQLEKIVEVLKPAKVWKEGSLFDFLDDDLRAERP